MDVQTHLGLDRALCGEPVSLDPDAATVRLSTLPSMVADDRGLVHGGFVFGAVDHAAMLAVNHPHVVLGAAEVRFLAPVALGDVVDCSARVVQRAGRKHHVEVSAEVAGRPVLSGTVTAFVLDAHVLDGRKG